jgi:hypothetical protein
MSMSWTRIPDKTKVQHRLDNTQGVVDGLTDLVLGPKRNPDRRTQYRLNVGVPQRVLVAEDDLLIVLDDQGLVMMEKESELYRRDVTARLRLAFAEERFCLYKATKGENKE